MARYYGYIGLNSLLLLEGRYEEIKKIFVPLAEQSRSMGAGEAEWNSRMAIAYSSLGDPAGRKRPSMNATKPTASMPEEWILIIKDRPSISKASLIWL